MAIEWLVKSSDKGCKVKKSAQLHTWVDTEMCPDTFLYPDTNVVPLRLHLKGYKRVSGNFYVAICIHLYLSKINIYKRQ